METTPQMLAPLLAESIWKNAPWARAEVRKARWAVTTWLWIGLVAALSFIPALVVALFVAPRSLWLPLLLGLMIGVIPTHIASMIALTVRASHQKAFLTQQLSSGVNPNDVRGIPAVPGRLSFERRLFYVNAGVYVVASVIAFLVLRITLPV